MTADLGRALTDIVRAELPAGMRGYVGVSHDFSDLDPKAHIRLETPSGGRAEVDVPLPPDGPAAMVSAVRAALPDAINECWASSLSLAPDEAYQQPWTAIRRAEGETDEEQLRWAAANAVDTDPTPPVTTPTQDGCTFCGAEPGEPHRGCVLR